MKITYEEMRDTAARLPVGYYLGRKVPVIVEPSGGAYLDMVKCEIHIGMSILAQAADHVTAADAAKWDREKLLRCVLYHEIGHVLLSPKWMLNLGVVDPASGCGFARREAHDFINIFEDERLERMLSSFFIGVDFNGFVHLVNGNASESKTAQQKFYNAVRLRKTTPEISAAVDDAIQSLVGINKATETCECIGSRYAASAYQEELNKLVKLILESADEPQEEDGKDDGEPREPEAPTKPSGESDPPKGCQTPRPVTMPANALKTIAGQLFSTPTPEVAKTLGRFAQRISKRKGAQAAGRWSALHGKIDMRRDAMDKERIFRRSSDVGERMMSSVNLTLWVDHSGSFRGSKDVLNQILAATAQAMKMSGGKLAVNVVKMEEYATVADEHDWMVDPNGDNAINNSYAAAWEKTRRRERRNIDIVVFDGTCSYSAYILHCGQSLANLRGTPNGYELDIVRKMWDNPDCWILSDTDNKELFDAMAPKSHRTYMKSGYATQLQAKVIEILDRIL